MSRLFLATLALSVFLPLSAWAAIPSVPAGISAGGVTFSSQTITAGVPVRLFVPIANSSDERFRGIVEFSAGGSVVAQADFDLEAHAGLVVASASWTPSLSGKQEVTASIARAAFFDSFGSPVEQRPAFVDAAPSQVVVAAGAAPVASAAGSSSGGGITLALPSVSEMIGTTTLASSSPLLQAAASGTDRAVRAVGSSTEQVLATVDKSRSGVVEHLGDVLGAEIARVPWSSFAGQKEEKNAASTSARAVTALKEGLASGAWKRDPVSFTWILLLTIVHGLLSHRWLLFALILLAAIVIIRTIFGLFHRDDNDRWDS